MNGSTRLVVVRHGESTWNAQRRIQGQSGEGLSERGRVQAAATADWVRASFPDAAVVSSDLARAEETAAPVAAALGVPHDRYESLRERHFGDWQGIRVEDLDTQDPDRTARWRAGVDVIGEVGGEYDGDFRERVRTALLDMADRHAGGTVVVTTHGGVIWHGLHALLDLPIPTLGPVDNACVNVLSLIGDRWSLDAWNQTAHLPAELRRTHAGNAHAPPVGR